MVGMLDFFGSHCVPITFPTMFSICSQQLFILCHILCSKFYSLKPIYLAQRRRLQHIYFGIVQSLNLFFGDGPIKDAQHKKEKERTLCVSTTN